MRTIEVVEDQDIEERVLAGETYEQIASELKVSKQRIAKVKAALNLDPIPLKAKIKDLEKTLFELQEEAEQWYKAADYYKIAWEGARESVRFWKGHSKTWQSIWFKDTKKRIIAEPTQIPEPVKRKRGRPRKNK